jgi:biotin carboxyl carrier protein
LDCAGKQTGIAALLFTARIFLWKLPKDKLTRIEWNGEPRESALGEYEIVELAPGHFIVSSNNENFEVFALPDGRLSDGGSLDGVEIKIESERERIIRERFNVTQLSGAVKTGARIIKAPMPGLVRAVKVKAGDLVEANTTLLVLEAMKMENNILAGTKGRVEKILVEESSSVEKNAKLIEIEPI